MAYSETRIVIGGLAHIPVLIFITSFIKGKFGVRMDEKIETVIKEEPVKVIDLKETVVKEETTKAIKELSSKLDNIEEKADAVYEKVKTNRKKKDMKRD